MIRHGQAAAKWSIIPDFIKSSMDGREGVCVYLAIPDQLYVIIPKIVLKKIPAMIMAIDETL